MLDPAARSSHRAREKIADVIRWADRQGLLNVAVELRGALTLLGDEPNEPAANRKRSNGR